jgi:predicted ATPase
MNALRFLNVIPVLVQVSLPPLIPIDEPLGIWIVSAIALGAIARIVANASKATESFFIFILQSSHTL